MKKLITLLFLFALAWTVQAQSYNFTPASNDSVVGAVTKYCTLASPITGRWNGAIEVYITPSISSSDSTHVWIEASINNSTWYQVKGTFGLPLLNNGTVYAAGTTYEYKARMGVTAASWLWSPTYYFNAPYYRVVVQHFKAATSVKITRAKIYLKK
jgi:hypothetical protein